MKLALSINGTQIETPLGVPTGGMDTAGQKIINLGFNLLFVVGVIITISFVIYSGIQWTLSGGDKEKIASARARLTYAIIGFVIIVTAFAIIKTVLSLIGYNSGFFFNFLNTT